MDFRVRVSSIVLLGHLIQKFVSYALSLTLFQTILCSQTDTNNDQHQAIGAKISENLRKLRGNVQIKIFWFFAKGKKLYDFGKRFQKFYFYSYILCFCRQQLHSVGVWRHIKRENGRASNVVVNLIIGVVLKPSLPSFVAKPVLNFMISFQTSSRPVDSARWSRQLLPMILPNCNDENSWLVFITKPSRPLPSHPVSSKNHTFDGRILTCDGSFEGASHNWDLRLALIGVNHLATFYL